MFFQMINSKDLFNSPVEIIIIISIAILLILFITVMLSFFKLKNIEKNTNNIFTENENDIDSDMIKVLYGISEDIISKYTNSFYEIYIKHLIEDKSNELLEEEYIELKKQFIKKFLETYVKSEVIGNYIVLFYSSIESFIDDLEDRFDIFLKQKYLERF